MCLLYIHTNFWEDCAKCVIRCLTLCARVSATCIYCMCVFVSGGLNERGWCLVWVDRQTVPCFQPDSNYLQRKRERDRERGGRDGWRQRESDRKTEGEMRSLRCFSKYYKHALLYCQFLIAEAFVSLFYGCIRSFLARRVPGLYSVLVSISCWCCLLLNSKLPPGLPAILFMTSI